MKALYDPDRAAGFIESLDRQKLRERHGLATASAGIVVWNGEAGYDFRRLVQIGAEVKSHAKRRGGSAVVENARALDESAATVTRVAPD